MLQKAKEDCSTLTKLKCWITTKRHIPTNCKELDPYRKVFPELAVVKQLVLRGEQIISSSPEVVVVLPKLDRILGMHGVPDKINGTLCKEEMFLPPQNYGRTPTW